MTHCLTIVHVRNKPTTTTNHIKHLYRNIHWPHIRPWSI